MELVRYIHLNPLRAELVMNYKNLKGFKYLGTVHWWIDADMLAKYGILPGYGSSPQRAMLLGSKGTKSDISTLAISKKLDI